MERQARLRINLAQREFEVEGSEEFVGGFVERFRELLDGLETAPVMAPAPVAYAGNGAAAPDAAPQQSFGEFIQRLPASATEVDKMLAAGFFVQQASPDDSFATGEANRRLTEQGIKLGNPSQCVKQSLLAKRVFITARGRYRVSQQGRGHLRQMLGPVIPD